MSKISKNVPNYQKCPKSQINSKISKNVPNVNTNKMSQIGSNCIYETTCQMSLMESKLLQISPNDY